MGQTLIYHITHVDNLSSILAEGGLWCKTQQIQRNIPYLNIAHTHIQDRRATTRVPCGSKGILHDYVPFYFAPRSPMLGAVHMDHVTGYEGGQEDVIYLVSAAEVIHQNNLPFVFTDGHATVKFSIYYTALDDLRHIDWAIMRDKYWRDTEEDQDRKRRRQAEFLIHSFVPLGSLLGLATHNQAVNEKVQGLLDTYAPGLKSGVRRHWYY